jgi:hypothetical protein
VAAQQRVTVVEDSSAEFGVARLLLQGAGGSGTEAVTWELCYGGVPVAAGPLASDQGTLFIEIASIEPAMDSSGFTISARYPDGDDCEIAATCVRPARPPTRAEATARAQWPDAQHQRAAPAPRRPFLAGTRDIPRPAPAGAKTVPSKPRSVCVYEHFSVLLARRRWFMRGGGRGARGTARAARG